MSVKKAASGAIEYLHMVEVVNLCRIITTMKTQHGYWVYGTGIKKRNRCRKYIHSKTSHHHHGQ